MRYEVSDFVADIDRILDDRGATVEAIWEMGPRLQRLVAGGGDLTKEGEASVGSTGLPAGYSTLTRRVGTSSFWRAFLPESLPRSIAITDGGWSVG